jgi:DNA-binding GntR family transcriptional regulator
VTLERGEPPLGVDVVDDVAASAGMSLTFCYTASQMIRLPSSPSSGRAMTRTVALVTVVDGLATSLRERILSGELAPGRAVSEVELSQEYSIARPTVRAAVQRLIHEGLLVRQPNRSPVVPVFTHDDVRDIYFARAPIETQVVRLLAERGDVPEPAAAQIRALEALPADAGWSEVVEADLGFHLALLEAVGSPRLQRLFGLLEGEIRLCIAQLQPVYDQPSELAAEHRELLDAIGAGDVPRAIAQMQQHLDAAVEDLGARAATAESDGRVTDSSARTA